MDQGLKSSKYKAYDIESIPQAEIYNHGGGSWPSDAVNGVPLYPEDAPGNPRLSRFVVQGCQDVWAAVLFIAAIIMTVVWGSVNMATYTPVSLPNSDSGSTPKSTNEISMTTITVLLTIFVISVAGACGSLLLLAYFPRQLIFIANVLTVVLALVAAVLAFISGVVFAGVLLLFMCVLQALWLYFVRDRIPFSAELLKAASDVLMRYKAVFMFNFLLSVVCLVYMFFWSAMALPPVDRVNQDNGGAGDGLLITLFMLIFFWVAQVVPNIMHVTTAGVTATWYFAGEGRMPKNPTAASFKRATTTSFGSVCFGSLIVAFIRLLRWLMESARENQNEFIRCITICILSCLERLVEYFNTYAFVHVAVYGCGYIEAAKRTWQLCKQCFFAAYFNDALIGSTLSVLSLGVSALIGVVVGLVMSSVIFGVLAFIVSLLVHLLFFTAVESAVTTFFVCYAEVPAGLQHSAPELYAALQNTDRNGTNNNAAVP
ncbi:hypothetical protein DQ04_03201090 [Trypanosoma grayi]|uniref:hypothetical protein n=1 Tax=Trypanosoma grayi TaxID=71804 RepID=UPI0004F42DE8|nr:hypothetical protein DQ04_03201090 [Trypanosoma grayi]KEG10875.1 hypothetical protein DQ04_03201090 [Trypanosoma grayi]